MFGIWRLILAFEVVVFHLLSVPVTGMYAVGSFFVLSGFLMTMIMNTTYGYTVKGFSAYWLNRMLRLYPNSWFAILFTVSAVSLFGPDAMRSYRFLMELPVSGLQWFENLSLIYLDWSPILVRPRLSPPTWALTVELVYYALIGIGLSRSPKLTLVWLGGSLAHFAASLVGNGSGLAVYGSIVAGSFPFATGAAVYHYREQIFDFVGARFWRLPAFLGLRWMLMLPMMAFMIFGSGDWRILAFGGVINVLVTAVITSGLFYLKPNSFLRTFDRFAGNYSYPVYLLHWQVAAVTSLAIFGEAVRGPSLASLFSFLVSTVLLVAVSSISVFLIDPAVDRVRDQVRRRRAVSQSVVASA